MATRLRENLHPSLLDGLRFFVPDERAYLLHHNRRAAILVRCTYPVGLLIYAGFAAMAQAANQLPDATALWLLPILPAMLGTLALSFVRRTLPWFHGLSALSSIVCSLSLIAAMTAGNWGRSPQEILVLNLLYASIFSGQLWRLAVPLNLLIATADAAAALWQQSLFSAFSQLLPLLGIAAIGCLTSLVVERDERRSWLLARHNSEQALRDPLTGLHNRRFLFAEGAARLRAAQREGRPMSALVVDIDRFKAFNDARGHLAGDDCLRRIAQVIDAYARRPLDLAARFGGEEFVLLLFGCERQAAMRRAEKLRQHVEALAIPHPAAETAIVTVSVGVATTALGHPVGLETLIGAADKAVYRAKRAGRNAVHG